MPQFRTLKEIDRYLKNNLTKMLSSDKGAKIEDYLKQKMYDSIYEHVYQAYKSTVYENRKKDGLSDPENMIMDTPYLDTKGNIKINFYNIATGADAGNENYYISDLIETGYDSMISWQMEGEWSNPRPFKEKMAEEIRANPEELIATLKRALRDSGFKTR